MLRQKRLVVLLTAALVLCAAGLTVSAHPAPDLSQKGSVKITMPYEKKTSGGSMTLYRVGAVREENGDYGFAPAGDFADCGIGLKNIESADLAKSLADYAGKAKLKGSTQKISGDRTVLFGDLEPGLYLMVQNEAAEGYHKANPFLVSVPMLEEGRYVYDVEAEPKVELTAIPSGTPGPDASPTPTPAPGTGGPKLPQTGQLNWPVPVFAALGLGIFSLGWILRYGKRNEDEK